MTLTDFDPPTRFISTPTCLLAVVRSTSHRFGEARLAAAIHHVAMDARSASADDVVANPRRLGGLIVLADSALGVASLLARLRASADGVLLPVLIWLRDAGAQSLLDPEWSAYADGVMDDRLAQNDLVGGLARMRRISDVRGTLSRPTDTLPAARRQLAILQYLASRELGRLAPRRAASRPLGHSFAPLDLLGGDGPISDLDALVRLGLLRTMFYERLHVCPKCADARLAFREVCGGCGSADMRNGEVLHHYACGHVAPEERFFRNDVLCCPSCGAALRHVGIDYERPAALVYCNGCGLADGEGATRALCLGCSASFGAEEVESRVLASYQLTADGLAAARGGVIAP